MSRPDLNQPSGPRTDGSRPAGGKLQTVLHFVACSGNSIRHHQDSTTELTDKSVSRPPNLAIDQDQLEEGLMAYEFAIDGPRRSMMVETSALVAAPANDLPRPFPGTGSRSQLVKRMSSLPLHGRNIPS